MSDTGAAPGPGQRLREAREAAELSQAEVATRLHLDRKTVAHLERDEYDKLPVPTFVRGYLSGYARLLDLPKGPIIEAYERRGHAQPSLVPDIAHTPQVRISDLPMRMVTYLIAGLLVVLVVLWWQHRQAPERAGDTLARVADQPAETATDPAPAGAASSDATAVDVPAEPSPGSGPAPVISAMPEPAAGPGSRLERPPVADAAADATTTADARNATASPPAESATRDGPAAGTLSALAPGETTASEAVTSTSPTPSAEQPVTADTLDATSARATNGPRAGEISAGTPAPAPAQDTPGASATAVASVEGEPGPPPAVPLPGSDELSINLARESWVEVYDRGGARLYYRLAHEGSEVVVTGAGPMRVLLGAFDGASVTYNGESFDLAPYRGRTVARFTVGEPRGTFSAEN